MRLRNPVTSRLDFVVDNNNPFVSLLVVNVLSEALGVHNIRLSREYTELKYSDSTGDVDNWDKDVKTAKWRIRKYFPEGNTKFDKYIKWVTRESNRINKDMIKWYKENRSVGHMIEEGLVTKGKITGQMYVAPGLSNNDSYNIVDRFASIVAWTESEGVNLYDYTLKEALELSEDFEIEYEGGPVQGDVVYEFEDGWTIQELRTDEQFDYEGEVMQHCVGSYCAAFVDSDYNIYSLRDPNGKPHVTMEIDGGGRAFSAEKRARFEQIKGKQNVAPSRKYREYIFEWLMSDWFMLSDEEIMRRRPRRSPARHQPLISVHGLPRNDGDQSPKNEIEFITGLLGMFAVGIDGDHISETIWILLTKIYLLLIDAVVNHAHHTEEDALLHVCDHGTSERVRIFACTRRGFVGILFRDIFEQLEHDEIKEMGSYFNQLTKKQKLWVTG